ncbi:hypothetical protein ACR3H8_27705 [Pseudomonas aeruginosa]|jgi:hypothetical protein|nr:MULTISPECIES: hypothetical protein [Pseudomonas]WQN30340.1 hypothetical protein ULE26_22480 [Stutzerimonas stutzeri]AGL46402.1 hypothetical protein pOZ176_444 [Pseudomonas aeruginosa PA96]AJA17248.1 hypothetical protein RPPX_28405 [Pseudomonas putida S12]ANI19040.1 hypothetical protein A9C11_32700 [Pseudomonas citronellolis]ANP63428.1 hypothetical protein A9P90_31750 [Pseudomonas aeruginosa]
MIQLTTDAAARALQMKRPDEPHTVRVAYKGHTFEVTLATGAPSIAPLDSTPWLFEHDDPAFYIDGEWWEHHVEVRLLVPDAGACQTRMPDSKVSASIPSFINPTFDVIVLCEDLIAEWVRMGSGTHASRR